MTRTKEILACVLLCGVTGSAVAFDDGTGKEWRQLYETVGPELEPDRGGVPARRRHAVHG
jgi:hypothetical protein